MNTTVVDAYVARLEAALRDEAAFELVMRELTADTNVRQQEAARICKEFYGAASSTLSKREAFRRIQARHDSLMDFAAKSRAQSGKSAA